MVCTNNLPSLLALCGFMTRCHLRLSVMSLVPDMCKGFAAAQSKGYVTKVLLVIKCSLVIS